MKVKTQTDVNMERQVLTALIVSTDVLVRLIPKLHGEAFTSKWSNLIASWCVQFYEQHKTAPGRLIQNVYAEWSSRGEKDDATTQSVDKFLSGLSDEHEREREEINVDYIVKAAGEHFNKVSIKRFSEEVQEDILTGDILKVTERIKTFNIPPSVERRGVDLCNDMDAIRRACEYDQKPSLIEYPSGLGDFFGDSLREDSFICLMGSDKSGKSFWLIDMAFRAMCQRRKVIYFEAGDMSEDQVTGRFVTRIAHRPLYPCQYDYPKEMNTTSKPATVTCETRQCNERLDFSTAWKATKKLMKDKVKSSQGYLKIHNYTTGTLKVEEMRSVIQDYIRTGFTPSVICVDYADILCPPAGKNMDARDQTNAIWKELAALRLEHHCLVITASQANAKAYGADTITRLNFSEDKRKLAHVTGMIGISSTAGEKAVGVCRLNWIVRRDRAYNDQKCCHVAGCLAIANPSILSIF